MRGMRDEDFFYFCFLNYNSDRKTKQQAKIYKRSIFCPFLYPIPTSRRIAEAEVNGRINAKITSTNNVVKATTGNQSTAEEEGKNCRFLYGLMS